jgi:hypothetical protein
LYQRALTTNPSPGKIGTDGIAQAADFGFFLPNAVKQPIGQLGLVVHDRCPVLFEDLDSRPLGLWQIRQKGYMWVPLFALLGEMFLLEMLHETAKVVTTFAYP